MPPKSDLNKAGWEQGDFPILCETCKHAWSPMPMSPNLMFLIQRKTGLGDNAFVRMVHISFTQHHVLKLTKSHCYYCSPNKSMADPAEHVHVPSQSSAGTQVPVCDSRLPLSARLVQRPRMFVRRACLTWSMACRLRSETPRLRSRTRPRVAI